MPLLSVANDLQILAREQDERMLRRFHASYTVGESADECWNWHGPVNSMGRARFKVGGRHLYAARVAWIIANGTIAPSMFVCHSCDNPRCVNTSHLFLGTHRDNMRDCAKKGRVGKRRYFSQGKREEIVTAWRFSGEKQHVFARRNGIHPVTLSNWSSQMKSAERS